MSIVPTAQSVLESSLHGRQRREERGIQKIDLQRARRYGMKEAGRFGRLKYTYGGVVFIYDPHRNREVTSFKSQDVALASSGTRATEPIILKKREETSDDVVRRTLQNRSIQLQKSKWTSHSVLVVDMSGSMRRDDVNGSRCRSDGVWMTLARDFVKKPLQERKRTANDVISVILMRDEAEIVVRHESIDWGLYNKFIDFREWTEHRPYGPGNYMPALDAAERLLLENQNSNCSLSLMFFSDGKPSDRGDFSQRMGDIAANFGRRLSIACIGMAGQSEDFSVLSEMTQEATSYGAVASFGKPSLDVDSLSNIITDLATSLTSSKTEMTNVATGKVRKVRMVQRERVGTPDDDYVNDNWTCYMNTSNETYVERVWTWSSTENDFAQLVDGRCRECLKDTCALDGKMAIKGENYRKEAGLVCKRCESCCFCATCYMKGRHRGSHRTSGECSKLKHKAMYGQIIAKAIPSFNIAVKKQIFGEGAERIVRKFRFIDKYRQFVGPIMVAKESRFIDDDDENYDQAYKNRMGYHREFMRTQTLAAKMAKDFNEAVRNSSSHFDNASVVDDILRCLPTIEFLRPLVVETRKEGYEYNTLIEPFLQGDYKKFNDNMGMVKGQSRDLSMNDLVGSMGGLGLGAIEEGSEEEDSDEEDSDDEGIFRTKDNAPHYGSYDLHTIKDDDVPQAFSHFTYEKSKRHFMVVDLQGVLSMKHGRKCFQLTDPVIHKRRTKKKEKLKKFTFGRTDRGDKGMRAFFESHRCTELCRLLGLNENERGPSIINESRESFKKLKNIDEYEFGSYYQ